MMLKKSLFSQELPQISAEAQTLYSYYLNCVKTESPSQVLERFRHLLIEIKDYPDQIVNNAFQAIINSKKISQEFSIILNQCSQILIYNWYQEKSSQLAISELIHLLTLESSGQKNYRYVSSEWKKNLKNFSQTLQYRQLQRLLLIINSEISIKIYHPHSLGYLLNRYPFLYQYFLLDHNSVQGYRRMIGKIKAEKQQEFELEIIKYLTLKSCNNTKNMSYQLKKNSSDFCQIIQNPSLLTDKKLTQALQYFITIVKNKNNQLQWLTTDSKIPFISFKKYLISYLLQDINHSSSNQKLKQYLVENLAQILSNCDSQPLNEFLLLRTCSQLLKILMLQENQDSNFISITQLINELGTTQTVGLFLKLILLAPKIKPHLEKQLAQFFDAYEFTEQQQVTWLIELLETVLIALTIYRGTINLPSTVFE